jgi:hypothetical protein
MTRFAITQTSLDARTLASQFMQMNKGDVYTYEQMNEIIHKNVLECRNVITRARSIAQRETRKVYRAVRKIGIKCLQDPEFVSIGEYNRRRTHRIANKTIRDLSCVDFNNLNQDEVHQVLSYASIAGATLALNHMRTLREAQAVIAIQDKPVRLDIKVVKQLL